MVTAPVKVGVIGECMVELIGQRFGQLQQNWGGDTYNTALYMRRLLDSSAFDIAYVSALGTDVMSDELIAQWQGQGLNTRWVRRFDWAMPGLYQINVDETGERTFVYWRDHAAAKYVFDDFSVQDVVDLLKPFDWVYLTGISLAILTSQGREQLFRALEEYVKFGGKIAFDNNYRPRLWDNAASAQDAYRKVLSLAQIALITEDDDQALWGFSNLKSLMSFYRVPELVVKRGEAEAVVRTYNDAGKQVVEKVKAIRVDKVVDTTAAGDSFAAGYLASRLSGQGCAEALGSGHRMASRVIQYPGAIIPLDAMVGLNDV